MIVIDMTSENTLFAVLCTLLGVLAIALALLLYVVVKIKENEHELLKKDVYVREEVEKPRVLQNNTENTEKDNVKSNKKLRHGKKNKNRNR